MIRTIVFNPWAGALEDAVGYLQRLPEFDVRTAVADPTDRALVEMGRLDCDWQGESVRCLTQPTEGFLPGWVVGAKGLAQFAEAARRRPAEETWWLLFTAQHPQHVGTALGTLAAFLRRSGVRIGYYAFDEASRTMTAFKDLAPHLDLLIHDEAPLDSKNQQRLNPQCVTIHRSWVANLLPFAAPYNPGPEQKILFLGSQMGLTDHRKRQIAFLQERFKDRFIPSHNHSVSIADRLSLNRYKVGFCPEGRKFATPAMARTHTDRPFWSGCLGLVPVSEDSVQGGRLEDLATAGMIVRYPHGDLNALAEACERALAFDDERRHAIYDYFNRNETVGTVMTKAILAVENR